MVVSGKQARRSEQLEAQGAPNATHTASTPAASVSRAVSTRDAAATTNYDRLLQYLDGLFAETTNVLAVRHLFTSREQRPGETFLEFCRRPQGESPLVQRPARRTWLRSSTRCRVGGFAGSSFVSTNLAASKMAARARRPVYKTALAESKYNSLHPSLKSALVPLRQIPSGVLPGFQHVPGRAKRRQHIVPVSAKLRRLPLALRQQDASELRRLQDDDVIVDSRGRRLHSRFNVSIQVLPAQAIYGGPAVQYDSQSTEVQLQLPATQGHPLGLQKEVLGIPPRLQ
ncbi:hypothetical protein HPB52_024358 [Rhipicephalus sanguineus]|uniref:Uncharacterized protein n=1 Tax=Rhipicephalus sanguineus TaxID=34632 RepID=A0A9D4PBU1_RHISA|nr:hypothetical protein HPB52_024358 [Rhipicephalus sanguineus]